MKLNRLICILGGLSLALAVISCSSETPEAEHTGQTASPAQTVSVPQETSSEIDSKSTLTGKVLEVHNGGGYTYIHLDTESGKKWVAMPETSVQEGEEISVVTEMTMENFESKSLERTFEEIIFCSGIEGSKSGSAATAHHMPSSGMDAMGKGRGTFADALQSEGPGAKTTQTPASTPMGSIGAIVPFADLKVDKAEGENSYTVGELFEKAAELDEKEVVVRGKVLKVSLSIMG
ncbi:MAG: DNA-binding protein, partial [Desulfobulbaceae bacterium]|nr:DNA-binding protein [Desulfobulbaceae bacterium]